MVGKIVKGVFSVMLMSAVLMSLGCAIISWGQEDLATQITVKAQDDAIPVDGRTRVTVRVMDKLGNPVAHVRVCLESDDTDKAVVTDDFVYTDSDGEVIVTVESAENKSGMVRIIGSIDRQEANVGLDDSDSAAINVAPGEAVEVTLSTQRNRIELDGETTVTARVRDEKGNPVKGVRVLFESDNTDRADAAETLVPTDYRGEAVVKVQSAENESGRVLITSSIESRDGNVDSDDSDSLSITIQPGNAVEVTLSTEHEKIGIDGSTPVTARAMDRRGNRVPDVRVRFHSDSPSRAKFSEPFVRTDADGMAVVQLESADNESGEVVIQATIDEKENNVDVSDADSAAVVVEPGNAVDLVLKTLYEHIDLGGSTKLSARATDSRGNPVPDVRVNFAGNNTDRAAVVEHEANTGSDGIATITVEASKNETGEVVITASIDDERYNVDQSAESRVTIEITGPGLESTPEPREEQPKTTDEPESAVPEQSRYGDAEKQQAVQNALINLLRVSVSSQETLHLSDGRITSNAARNDLTTSLAELTFQVIDGMEGLEFDATGAQMDAFRTSNRCNLAFLIRGDSRKVDKFGNFYSYESEMEGKVLNLATHQVIARKSATQRGERKLNERQAAESALSKTAEEISAYLTDEVARLWEVTSVMKLEIAIRNLSDVSAADAVRSELQGRPGVQYVSLESWSAGDGTAVLEVLCRFDTHRFLVDYVEDSLRQRGLTIERIERGEAIRAR